MLVPLACCLGIYGGQGRENAVSDENSDLINTPYVSVSVKEGTVDDILGRAKRLGIKFEEGVEEHLDRLSELQLLPSGCRAGACLFGQRRNRYDLAGRGYRKA
jgi:hypothetical protein